MALIFGGPGMVMAINGKHLYGGAPYQMLDGSIYQASMNAAVSEDTVSIRFVSIRQSNGDYQHNHKICAIYKLL